MKYKQLTIKVKREEADLVAFAFVEAGSEGANIIDGKEMNDLLSSGRGWDYFDETLYALDVENAVISGGFAPGFDETALAEVISGYLGREVELFSEMCDSADWENEWRKYYKPIDFGSIAIVPAWLENKYGDRAVIINPGMAFGTGNHETTGMCIKLLQQTDINGQRVIDVGCGSGILGISALVLGAAECAFIDIDPLAVEATQANLALNSINGQTTVICGDLVADVSEKADVVIANITADILLRLRVDLCNVLKNGGKLIISGIIDSRRDEVFNAFSRDFRIITKLREKEWNAFLFFGKA